MAQVCSPPAMTDNQPVAAGEVTCCGRSALVVLPMPSSPELLLPQHHSVWTVLTPQVWEPPAEMCAQAMVDPVALAAVTPRG